jgi:hypothetical protein
MATRTNLNPSRQLLQFGAMLLVAAGVGWALGADWKAVAIFVAVAAILGLVGSITRRGKRNG